MEASGGLGWTKLGARSGALRVRFEEYQRGKHNRGTRVTIEHPGRHFGLTLRPESFGTALGKLLLAAREIEIGDELFDAAFYVDGVPARVRAALDAETRRLLGVLNGRTRLAVANDEFQAELREESHTTLNAELPRVLGMMLDVGRCLTLSLDAGKRLADSVRRDPEPAVRLQNLMCLIREFAEHPAAPDALRAALADRSSEIRIRAAVALGDEGRETLLQLAEDPALDDARAAQAVSALGRQLSPELASEILGRALRARRLDTARACLQSLGRSGAAPAVAPLVKVLAVETGDLAAAAAQALGALGALAPEGPLIDVLRHDAPGLGVAAAEALGKVGSVAAVLPLKEAADAGWSERDFSRAARQAIAQIQSRLSGASPGQLSLAGAEGGQLSLAAGDAGQLSLAAGAAGQLSLPVAEAGQLSLGEPVRAEPESDS